MDLCRRQKRFAAAWAAVICLACPALAAPPGIGRLTSITSPPSAAQADTIQKYAEYWTGRLASRDPVEVGEAEKKLSGPAVAPGATLVFRDAYSDIVLPLLRPIIDDESEGRRYFQPVNALLVAAKIGTEDALRLMVDHCDILMESRPSVRLWAAKGFGIIFDRAGADITARKALPAIRAMGDAAAAEEVPWVLYHQLDALASTDQTNTEKVVFDALDRITERLKKEEKANELIASLRPALVALRDRFLNNQGQQDLAIRMAPRLAVLLEIPLAHWGTAQENGMRGDYEETIRLLEKNLQYIDRQVSRPPRITTELEKAFQENDRERYQSQMRDISSALSQPPYR